MTANGERAATPHEREPATLPRRAILGGAVSVAALAACSTDSSDSRIQTSSGPVVATESTQTEPSQTSSAAASSTQLGIDRPQVPQAFALLTVWDLAAPTGIPSLLRSLGRRAARLVDSGQSAGESPVGLSVTLGLGERAARAAGLPEPIGTLPPFASDDLGSGPTGGDLVTLVRAEEPATVLGATDDLGSLLTRGDRGRRSWSQFAVRGPVSPQGVSRNVIGFHDGVVQPVGAEELDESVWMRPPGGDSVLAGATTFVVRRMVIDVERFNALSRHRQEAVIGRDKVTGAPIGGTSIDSPVDLAAKNPDGSYVLPVGAHVRRAHPAATGRPLMLRRSYSFVSDAEQGLLFMSFQRDLSAFVQTQYRLDAADDLMAFTRTTASGAFWVPPRSLLGSA